MLYQFHIFDSSIRYDTGARPPSFSRCHHGPREEVGIVVELGIMEQRYDAVNEVLEGKGP